MTDWGGHVPKPGDGDLWPTTDDDNRRDEQSAPVSDVATHQLPVPDQQEKADSGGWFDPPAADEPDSGRDKSHAKPAQQRTQPVSWAVAELERQAKSPDAEKTAFVRPVQLPDRPSQQAPKATQSSGSENKAAEPKPAKRPEPTEPEKSATQDHVPQKPSQQEPAAKKPAEPEPAVERSAESESAVERSAESESAAEKAAESESATGKPAESGSATGKPAEPEPVAEKAAKPESVAGKSAGLESAPEKAAESESAPEKAAESGSTVEKLAGPESAGEAKLAEPDPRDETGPAQPEPTGETEPAEPKSAEPTPAESKPEASKPKPDNAPAKQKDDHPKAGPSTRSWFDSQEDDQPAWPTQSESPRSAGATVNVFRPTAEPSQPDTPAKPANASRAALSFSQPPSAEGPTANLPKPATAESTEAKADDAADHAKPAGGTAGGHLRPPAVDQPSTSDAPGSAFPRSPGTDTDRPRSAEADRTVANLPKPPTSADRTVAKFAQPGTTFPKPPGTGGNLPNPRTNAPGAKPSAADSATVYLPKPTQPPQPTQPPPSFIRPRQEAESTAFIPRPPQQQSTRSLPQPDHKNEWPPPEPPRAAPQRVGPPPQEPPAPRKPRKRLLVAAVAIMAILGVAAGVIFGVPGIAEKLGLTGEDAVAIAPPPAPVNYSADLHGPDTSAPTPTQQGVQRALAGPVANPALGTITGTVIDPTTGQTLYERDAGNAITPASTGKLLTAAAALLSLDHTDQLVTKVVQGDQPGEVIIVGGGDPTISSLQPGNDDSVFPGAAHLTDLVDQVKKSGAQVSTVYIDQSRYAAPRMAASWLPEDVAGGYIAPIVPAMLDADRRDAKVNYSPRTNDPGRTLVNEFARRVGATAAGQIEKKAPANAKVLGEIRSAPISQLVDNMLDRSENTLGDILAHEVAIKAGEEPNFDGASRAVLNILRQNKFDVDGAVLKDGSGMSTENKVSAKLLAQILAVAAGPDGKDPRTAKLRPLLGGLPVAGGSGTLADRYNQGTAAEGRGWVRAKTGTLTGVNSLAGIVMDKDNRPLVFAFLTSGTNGGTARPALDTVSAALRGCGCQ